MNKKKFSITTKEAIEITGYTSQRLNQLVKEEVITKAKHGCWDIKKLFSEVSAHKIKLAIDPFQKELVKLRESDPEYRLKKIKADDAEYDLMIKQKKLLYDNDILDFLKKFGVLIVKEFEPIGRECTSQFKYLKDDTEKIDVVVKIKDNTLDRIASTNINTLLPDIFRNSAADSIKNRKRISGKSKTKTDSKD